MPSKTPSKRSTNHTKKPTSRQDQKKRLGVLLSCIVGGVLVLGGGLYFLIAGDASRSDAVMAVADCKLKPSPGKAKKAVNNGRHAGGFFFYTSSNQCTNRQQLQDAKHYGAGYAVTFGARMRVVSGPDLRKGDYSSFRINNRPALEHISRQTGGGSIRKMYTYNNKESYSSNSLRCGNRNGVVVRDGKMYTWWLLAVNSAYSACTDSRKQYDLVVSYNANAKTDGNANMIINAQRLGMKAILGLPNPNTDPKAPYLATSNAQDRHTVAAFTTRVVKTWQQRYGNRTGFDGTYLTLESAVGGKPHIWRQNYQIYEVQSKVVGWNLSNSKKSILISPYVTGSLNGAANSMRNMVNAIKKGNGTRAILMPQDGAGTGRIGNLSNIRTLYSEARKAGAWRVWANLEAFRPGGSPGNRKPMPSNGNRYKEQRRQAIASGAPNLRIFVYDWNTFKDSNVGPNL